MNVTAIWNLFAMTGDPRFYLIYRLLTKQGFKAA